MKLGRIEHFCNCLLHNLREHVTAIDEEGDCLYCGHVAVKREITEKDIRTDLKYGQELEKKKFEALELYVKEQIHGEKIN